MRTIGNKLRTRPALLVDGHWIEAEERETIPLVNPATEEVIGQVPAATDRDIGAALDAAGSAFLAWRDTTPYARSQVLRRAAGLIRDRAEEMAVSLSAEQGKIIAEARAEVLTCADLFDWFAEECRRSYGRIVESRQKGLELRVVSEPVGSVAAFCTWNFPGLVPARKIGAALAAGCSVVVKASEETPSTTIHLAQALMDAGLPDGALNILFGDPGAISSRLIASPQIRMVSLTGSMRVGKIIAGLAAEQMKPGVFELGGHNPVIIFGDADIDKAVAECATAKFRNAGQVCIAPDRFFVHESLHDRFVEKMVDYASDLQVGEGLDPASRMGALTNRARLDEVSNLVDDAVALGARLCFGGARIGNRGYFYSPTILSEVPDEAMVMQVEPFGPIAPIQRFSAMEEALEKANRLSYGLSSYLFSRSPKTIAEASATLEAGLVGVNTCLVSHHEGPLGGVKESGYGREGSVEGLRAYQITKLVAQDNI